MNLSDAAESRVKGYLFVLGRSLRSSLPREIALDALHEIESHLRERLSGAEALPNESAAVERVLAELGTPLRVAQAYSAEHAIEEALGTGALGATLRAVWLQAWTTVRGFFVGLALLVGYLTGASLVAVAALKPIFPENVGVMLRNGVPVAFGVLLSRPADVRVWGGYWVIPAALAAGAAVIVATHRSARRFLSRLRDRTARA